MFIADEELALLVKLLLSVALGTLLGFSQRAVRQGPGTFSMISLAGSTCTSVFMFAGMTVAQLAREFMFIAVVAAPIFGFLLMRLLAERRIRDLELLLGIVLAIAVGITSGMDNYALALLLTGIALLCFRLLHRIAL